VLFKSPTGDQSRAQVQAFKDTWRWGLETGRALLEIEERRPDIHEYLGCLLKFMGKDNLAAYLVMMSVRLIEIHRILKSTGSLYIHCDPNAGHYLKVIIDGIFGKANFRDDIV
jgi:site-specific DNA-methyltransferase (adenine-specific)